jgi:predicted kinase
VAVPTQRIVVCVGLPGSGKSTWLERKKSKSLSSDDIRVLLSGDVSNMGIHAEVFETIRYLLEKRIKLGCSVTYVDATHLTPWEREPYFAIARKHQCVVEAVFFDIPLELCLVRNRARRRKVPVAALRRMAKKMVEPTKAEGFSRIIRITPERQRV